jgi:phenylacetate-CoA ligase
MRDKLLQIYHQLPGPARSAVANLRGLHLRSWRYGPETDLLVEEALEREHWSPERLKHWQEKRLTVVLDHAATQVPYYRDQWAKRRRHGDRASWEYLENWPILEKERLRENSKAFVAQGCKTSRMFHDHTSGTTGKSLDLWFSKETVRTWYALFEARSRRWYGLSRHDRWAILGGQLISEVKRRRPPFWVWNAALNQLYMSSYHLAPDLVPSYLDALHRYRITYLLGYTSSLYELAQCVLQSGRRDMKMSVVITNAEPIFAYQRRAIEEAFHCAVRETYGMAEATTAASECPAGQLHLWPEAGLLELLDEALPVPNGASGEVIATGLLNLDMPLIRYRVGDHATLPLNGSMCVCGRTLPIIASVDGRLDDVLYASDGRRIGRLDPIFKSGLPIREAQIIQESLDRVRVRYVPATDFNVAAGRSITERLRQRMGCVEVVLEAVDQVPRTANGKFRAAICQLTPEEIKLCANSAPL